MSFVKAAKIWTAKLTSVPGRRSGIYLDAFQTEAEARLCAGRAKAEYEKRGEEFANELLQKLEEKKASKSATRQSSQKGVVWYKRVSQWRVQVRDKCGGNFSEDQEGAVISKAKHLWGLFEAGKIHGTSNIKPTRSMGKMSTSTPGVSQIRPGVFQMQLNVLPGSCRRTCF